MSKEFNKYQSRAIEIIKSYEDSEYYRDNFKSFLLAQIGDAKKVNLLPINTIPFLNFATDNLSVMYNGQTIRTINTEDETINDLLTEVSNAYNKVAVNVDKYTFTSGMVALKSHWDDIDQEFEYVIYSNNMIGYTPRPDNYEKMDELILEFNYDSNKSEEAWSSTSFTNTIDGIALKNTENPYGEIPFSIFRNKKTPNSWFCAPNTALLDIQNNLSFKLTGYSNTFKFQSMAMVVVSGGGDLKSLNFGASAVNQVDTEDDIKFATPNISMTELSEAINNEIKLHSRMINIPDSLISAQSTQSGVSIIVSQRMLDEHIKERSKIFTEPEEKAILQGMKVLAYHKGITLPEDLKVSVNHMAANSITKLTKEEMELWEFYMKHNIYTNVDLMKKMNPNMTDEEAEAKIKENKEIFDDNLINSEDNEVQETIIEETE